MLTDCLFVLLLSLLFCGVASKTMEVIGGGAINEKSRNLVQSIDSNNQAPNDSSQVETLSSSVASSQYEPSQHRSHLWHALEGLDRYPNYLSRWNDDDVRKLETALEEQLFKVRTQRREIQQRKDGIAAVIETIRSQWTDLLDGPVDWDDVLPVLDPQIRNTVFRSKQFLRNRPSLRQVLSGEVAVELDAHLLEDVMDQELFDVYSLPLLDPDFCDRLRDYCRTVAAQAEATNPELRLGSRPVNLDLVGLPWLNDLLLHLIIRPISRHLFRDHEILGDLDWRQGYITGYSAKPASRSATPRQRLVTHTDDSEVTLNLCVGDDFEGGALQFRGLRGDTADAAQVLGDFQPMKGTALLHAGRHFHEVTTVTKGDRYAYIVWARSWSGTRKENCPCCWLNRRQDNSCVCGRRWN